MAKNALSSSPPVVLSGHATYFSPSSTGAHASFVTLISDPITKFKGHFYGRREDPRSAAEAYAALTQEQREVEGDADRWKAKTLGECVKRKDEVKFKFTKKNCQDS